MSNLAGASPLFSVVLVAASGAASIARTLAHLRGQSARRSIELLVVVADERDVAGADFGSDDFHAVRLVAIGKIKERGHAAAQGMARATAPIVGLVEDHSFPEPGWAEAHIRAHSASWAGVGPAVTNANPESAVSWVNFVLAYGAFSPPQLAGPRDIIPWHNSSYKSELLQPYLPRLGELLSWEGALQQELCDSGHALFLDPAAQTSHANVSRFRSSIGLNVQRGRMMGALRAERERWPAWRRWMYAVAFPLYPFMQARFVVPRVRQQPLTATMRIRTFLMLVPSLLAMAVGEAHGILAGKGRALQLLEDYELHRLKHVSRKERQEILDPANKHQFMAQSTQDNRHATASTTSFK